MHEFNMTNDSLKNDSLKNERALPDAAKRALQEAQERKRASNQKRADPEKGGPQGPEPTRYGDWERKGRAVDF